LLHALNQPLTGLQCSMEVALASPRTAEQHVQRLREGLELTERMRALVEAIREVAQSGAERDRDEDGEAIELNALVREVVADLKPVAEVKGVGLRIEGGEGSSLWVKAGRGSLPTLVFRMLESALSLADGGSPLRIELSGVADEGWIRMGWHATLQANDFSRAELGLLVAEAGWERRGAKWKRERAGNRETVMVQLPTLDG
jgi:signal transduction histidine kinase